ncbi:MAG: hypothetical protein ACRDBO_03460 [Lachnospiraceae bacterium]
MLQDCIAIFKDTLEKNKNIIIDNYVPKDGTYLLIRMENGNFQADTPLEIFYDKKIGLVEGKADTRYPYIAKLDYCSKLVEMNKPIDSKKTIHSNNYLSFFVKKESLTTGKLTDEIIDGYYEVLKDPGKKYEKKAKSREIYQKIETDLGKPDIKIIEKVHTWIKSHIWDVEFDNRKKDYLKVFFILPNQEQTIKLYEKEERRYVIPNIYNSNDFNRIVGEQILGLPNNNMGMNAKKPFLEYKSKKIKEPLLLSLDEVLLQNSFFEYLLSKVSVGNVNLYVDTISRKMDFYKSSEFPSDFKCGFFMRLQKEKNEVAILDLELIPEYNSHLKNQFVFKTIIECSEDSIKRLESGYGGKSERYELEQIINEVLFNKWLSGNYFTDPGDIRLNDGMLKFCLLKGRKRLWSWMRGGGNEPSELLNRLSMDIIKNTISNGYLEKSVHQLNLRWSLIDYFSGSNKMEELMNKVRVALRGHVNAKDDWEFENDQEYYYAVGQLLRYYLSKTRSIRVTQSLVNPFLNARQDRVIKNRLQQLYKKTNYDIDVTNPRVNNLISHIHTYDPQESVDQDYLMGGFTSSLLIYEKD